jgi:hypothetical protein
MPAYIAEVAYVHSQDEIDWLDVDAETRAEASVAAETQFRRRAWLTLHDPQIVSVTVHEADHRYSLNLQSDRADLDVREVGE